MKFILVFISILFSLIAFCDDAVQVSAAKKPVKFEDTKIQTKNNTKDFKKYTLCNLTPDKKHKRSLSINCGHDNAHISHQSLVKEPVYKINFKIPLKDKTGFFTGDFDYEIENTDCTTLKCFNEINIQEKMLEENPNLFQLLQEMAKEPIDLENLENIIFDNKLVRAHVNNYTPIFTEPIDELLTDQIDIDAQGDNYIGNLIQEIPDDGEPKVSINFLPPDEEYINHFLREEPSDEEFIALEEEMNENPAFSDAEIAAYELEFDGAIPDPNLTAHVIDELTSDVRDIIAEMDANLAVTIQVKKEQDPNQLEDDDLTNDDQDVKGESFELKFGDKKFTITHNSSQDEKDQFTISDGNYFQKFDTSEFSTLNQDYITDLSFQDGKINYKLLGFDETLPMDATHISKHLSHETPETDENKDLEKCLTSLNDFVHNKGYSEAKIQKFLNLQGKLTLHRLAWAHLNKAGAKDKIENHILSLIKQKYSSENSEIANQFDNMNLKSRNFLAKGLPLVIDIIYKQQEDQSTETKPYKIHKSDLTFLEMVAEFEGRKNESYDHKQFDTGKIENNITNFSTIINSSYQNSSHHLETKNDIEKNQELLIGEIGSHEAKLNSLIKGFIYESCFEPQGLSCIEVQDQVETLLEQEANNILPALIKSVTASKDEDYLNDIRFRKLWLKVAK